MASLAPAALLQGRDRATHYYDSVRADVAALVPPGATRVLDVGCGRGNLGRLLRERDHVVSGIELIPAVAELARPQLDEVVCIDIEHGELPWHPATFDAILCADVLEHLADPWRTLDRLAALLAPGGRLIASIPNVQNGRVIWGLLRGRWRYRERGILDHGHLRFFTWDSIIDLFGQAGLRVVVRHANYRRTPLRRLLALLGAEQFLARSYLAVGVRAA